MGKQRRSFTAEFKAEVIAAVKAGKSPVEVAKEAKIHPSMVYTWMHRVNGKPRKSKPNGHAPSSRVELTRLQRELRATVFTQRRLIERIGTLTAAETVERIQADITRTVNAK